MIEEAYVTKKTAKLLEEKGFNEVDSCNALIDKYLCPTHQMTMRWLREVHDIIIGVSPHMLEDKTFQYSIYKDWIWESSLGRFDSYEKACEAAIKYSLEHLI